jgi:uncharacterized membrane protein HdeD (DUF308 family)
VLVTDPTRRLSDRTRARLIAAAGWLIVLLAAGAALLPFTDRATGATLVGSLLIAAGVIEILAGSLRGGTRPLAMLAGLITVAAGCLFFVDKGGRFVPIVTIVAAWLLVRGATLLVASRGAAGPVRLWVIISAATDLALGLILLAGISIGTLVVALFGPTPTLIASFSWVLALSFVVTGVLLLQVASCERDVAS